MITVKLGYNDYGCNDHGYNVLTSITNNVKFASADNLLHKSWRF